MRHRRGWRRGLCDRGITGLMTISPSRARQIADYDGLVSLWNQRVRDADCRSRGRENGRTRGSPFRRQGDGLFYRTEKHA
ncbi:hypothetical protein KCP74_13895 [Salmonella enterica subsp. enterica]|nr:hypothetical protein KCP74_13895 [Salmonella enterica subsp. enterica]